MPKPLIIDNGLYVSMAARMARDMEVAYSSTWINAFPRSREIAPGLGLKNVERVDDPVRYFLEGKASHIIVPDLYLGDYEKLASAIEGFPLWGSGEGNRLELDRWFLKEFLSSHGLDVINSVEIEGIHEVEKYIEDGHEDGYVKVSVFRGDFETSKAADHASWLHDLATRLGPLADKCRFIVDDPIDDAVEIGIDSFYQGKVLVFPCFWGPEIKDCGYAGQRIEGEKAFSPQIKAIMDALSEYFGKTQYANFFSNEMRVLKDGRTYMTDATCRPPSPPGGVMMAAMKNFTPFVLETAADGYPKADWGDVQWICEIVMKSDWLEEHWLELNIPPSMKDYVAMHNYCEIDGKTWIIPHDSGYVEFGSACGWGSTLEEAGKMAAEVAESIKGFHVYFDDDVIEKAEEEFEKLSH